MSEIKLLKTDKGKDCLVIDGFKMVKNKVSDTGSYYWYCVNKNSDFHCRSTAVSVVCSNTGNHVLKTPMTTHNHAPQPGKRLHVS